MKRHAPATERNREAIGDVLAGLLSSDGSMALEIASGTGEHVTAFARRFPRVTWQPSDPDPEARASIAAWTEAEQIPNIFPPLDLDAASADWPIEWADAIVCINMVHISPWEATVGLMRNAERLLSANAPLLLYGPYLQQGVETAPSNLAFDADLRARNPAWGLRQLEDVVALAADHGLVHDTLHPMPSNNLMIVLRRR